MSLFRKPNHPYSKGEQTHSEGYSAAGITGRSGFRINPTILIALALAAFSYFKYCSAKTYNEYVGKYQHVDISPEQEISLGLSSAPAMIQQHGGLHPDQRGQQIVKGVGEKLVQNTIAKSTPYPYDFHLLADDQVINAFALPGGQVFITAALFNKLRNEDQLAGVLGHEIGHVVARHSGERMTKQELFSGLGSAVSVGTGDMSSGQMVQQMLMQYNLPYDRDHELESDDLGVRFMLDAGYNPEEMIGVMEILKAAAGPDRVPERMSTHPDPENRIEKIRAAIEKYKSQKNQSK
jgi:predicted Zn-dependent protease